MDYHKTDAFVQVLLGTDVIIRTHSVTDDRNPLWNQSFCIDVCHFASELKILVWDEDPLRNEFVGCVKFPISDLVIETTKDDWYDIINEDGSSVYRRINIRIQFDSLKTLQNPSYEVESYFPVKNSCFVNLYQNYIQR